MRKATGNFRTYSSLVKLQPRFLSLKWKTCLWAKFQPWCLSLQWRTCPWAEHWWWWSGQSAEFWNFHINCYYFIILIPQILNIKNRKHTKFQFNWYILKKLFNLKEYYGQNDLFIVKYVIKIIEYMKLLLKMLNALLQNLMLMEHFWICTLNLI